MPHDEVMVAGGVMLLVKFVIFHATRAAARALVAAVLFRSKQTATEKFSHIRFA